MQLRMNFSCISKFLPLFCRSVSGLSSNFPSNFLRRHSKVLWQHHIKLCSISTDISLSDPTVRKYLDNLEKKYSDLSINNQNVNNLEFKHEFEKYTNSSDVIMILNKIMPVKHDLAALLELSAEKNEELDRLVKEERKEYEDELLILENQLLEALLPADIEDSFKNIILEVNAGVGGQEAMLFAAEIFEMYHSYVSYKGWKSEIIEMSTSDLGGLRRACLLVSGADCNRFLRFEGGVHRVQRIPKTEKTGRMHTSTITVAALPQPNEIDVVVLDKDLKVETKRASGPGGQSVNVSDSAVRIVHIPSGITVECQTARTQHKNKEFALQKLRALLYKKEKDEQDSKVIASRKTQIGSCGRSEKIRTYNFSQDRITDHRISKSVFNVAGFLEGNSSLDELINQIYNKYRKERLEILLETITSR